MSELFDDRFRQMLGELVRRMPRTRTTSRAQTPTRRRRRSESGTFSGHRAYTPGDDLRAIDWNIYSRLGRVFVRLYEELEDLPLYVLPDVSRSAFLETPPRARAGLRAGLALSAMSLNQHDSVGVFPFSDDLSVLVRPAAGKRRVLTLAERFAELVRSIEARREDPGPSRQ